MEKSLIRPISEKRTGRTGQLIMTSDLFFTDNFRSHISVLRNAALKGNKIGSKKVFSSTEK